MTGLLTAAQMRTLERMAMDTGEATGLELMERAGKGVVEAIFEEWPELKAEPQRAVVLCGPGNNGGDGFVVARLLKERGWEVLVRFLRARDRQPPDAGEMHDRWIAAGGEVFPIPDPLRPDAPLPPEPWREDLGDGGALIVDALFGTGLTRPISVESGLWRAFGGYFDDAVDEEDLPVRRVSIDVPSGLCADSGRILSPFGRANFRPCFHADLTVATGSLKVGHYLGEGPETCGKSVWADLGPLDGRAYGKPGYRNPAENCVRLVTRDRLTAGRRLHGWMGHRFLGKGLPGRLPEHKYAHGHALILSGPSGRGGAARLAARGALRIGAGLVTVGCPPEAIPENAARLDAVMLRPVAEGDALGRVLEDGRINALCLGPGLGTGEREAGLLAAVLGVVLPPPSPPHEGDGSREGRPSRAGGAGEALPRPLVARGKLMATPRALVLDADALTILAREPGLFAALHKACVLTPHEGEFARLFPDIAARLAEPAAKGPAYSKVDATRAAAARAGCVVLFKGPDTVIADPTGRCSINSAHYDRVAPWLATAGSGDVLSGFIAGLLARGFDPMEAAGTAAWLHVECARRFGPGLIAEDLPEQLPAVFRDLGL